MIVIHDGDQTKVLNRVHESTFKKPLDGFVLWQDSYMQNFGI